MIVDGLQQAIPTWSEPETLRYWSDLAKGAAHAVESGVYLGASTYAMLEANPNLHLWAVDHFQAFAFNEQVVRVLLGKFIKEGRLELIVGDTNKAFEILNGHMGEKIDLAVVDDGHAEVDLQRDIRCLLPLLRSGGKMVFHDFDVPHNDVARGILSMLPASQLQFPVPRGCLYVKP